MTTSAEIVAETPGMVNAGTPTLSVVIPNYNDGRFLGHQLTALLSQSYAPCEILIVDDASTDNSVQIIESFTARAPHVRLIRNTKNMGVEHNNTVLLGEAKGDYIYLAAADDVVMPRFFEESMRLLAQYPQAALCSGLGRTMSEAGEDTGLRSLPVISRTACFLAPADVRRMLRRYGRWFNICSLIIRREALLAEGDLVAAAGSFADNLGAMVLALRHGACFIPQEFSFWRQKVGSHARSNSANWKRLLDQGTLVVGLMRTKYADLFPEDFVRTFERHWAYMVHMSATDTPAVTADPFGPVLRAVPVRTTATDRACVSGMQILTALRVRLWRLYALVRFGSWKWWILGRLSITWNLGRVLIKENQRP